MTSHIAFYIPDLHLGGAERVTVNIANGFVAEGCTVDLLLVEQRGQLLNQVADGVNVLQLGNPTLFRFGVGSSVPHLHQYLKSETPDILFSAMTHSNLVAIVTNQLAQVETTVVATEHDTLGFTNSYLDQAVSWTAEKAYALSDEVVAVSEGVADSIREKTWVNPENITVIPNPLDIEHIQRQSIDEPDHPWIQSDTIDVIFTLGRLEPQKDIPTLLRAFRTVHRSRSNTRLLIAGEGSQRRKLEREVQRLGIEEYVTFTGYVENPYPYMRYADVFALSSVHEGLPTVLIEALACGCPIVATDCPSGPREILADGEFGTLVPVGDDDRFADAVLAALDDPLDPTTLHGRAHEYSLDSVMETYMRFVESRKS